jgi:hypothetical protein
MKRVHLGQSKYTAPQIKLNVSVSVNIWLLIFVVVHYKPCFLFWQIMKCSKQRLN